MRIKFKELMTKLGVTHEMQAYETYPWTHYDEDKGKTFSGEVRMDTTGDSCEAEFQVWFDTPPEGKSALDQIVYIKATIHKGLWEVDMVKIRNVSYVNKFYDWDGKACNLFRALCQEVGMAQSPDVDALIKEHMKESKSGTQQGEGGGKSPRIRPEQLLDMKKGGGVGF